MAPVRHAAARDATDYRLKLCTAIPQAFVGKVI
jgi:hypothetical protein